MATSDWKSHVQRAVDHLGSQNQLAEAMGCSQSKVSWLLVTAKQISAEDAVAIDRATGGEVTKTELRPDLWPPDRNAAITPETIREAS